MAKFTFTYGTNEQLVLIETKKDFPLTFFHQSASHQRPLLTDWRHFENLFDFR
jgi:hypothetical protein